MSGQQHPDDGGDHEPARLAEMLVAISERVAALSSSDLGVARPASDVITHLDRAEIDGFLTSTVAGCRRELLTAQPQVDRGAAALATAMVRDIAALERGVAIRTLYQHSARHSTVEQQYVERVTPLGAEVRTLDEFFDRMIVVDRAVAIIPGPHGNVSAVAVREPAVVRFLVDTFERAWERGRLFTAGDDDTVREIAESRRAMAVRMLIEGHSDANSARRMGVSPRTFANYVADLRAEYGAQTRFQLGYKMGRLGVGSGRGEE